MTCRLLPLLALVGALSAAHAETTPNWTKLKAGMTSQEAYAVLGRPLIRNAGRGFEVWIYNSNAEVLFVQGPVFAWTEPTPRPSDETHPADQDLPLQPKLRLPPKHRVGPQAPAEDGAGDNSATTHFRYQPGY